MVNNIKETCHSAEQTVFYDWIGHIGSHTFRVTIHRNAHDFQSWARGFIFSPTTLQWNQIVDFPISELICRRATYHKFSVNDFVEDRIAILEVMQKISSASLTPNGPYWYCDECHARMDADEWTYEYMAENGTPVCNADDCGGRDMKLIT